MERSDAECTHKHMIRYTSAPTKFDVAPFKSLCSVLKNDEGTEHELFIQLSKDENNAHWVSATELMSHVYRDRLQDPCWIENLLGEYENDRRLRDKNSPI